MEQLIQFSLDMSKYKKLSDTQVSIKIIEDYLNDLEEKYPEQVQLIREIIDTMED